MKTKKTLWGLPALRTGHHEEEERKATWMELFFDLIVVAVVAELGQFLSVHLNWHGVLAYALLFAPAWWGWVGVSVYADRFDNDGLLDRLLIGLQMLAVSAMAINVAHATSTTGAQFAWAYAVVRAIVVLMNLRAAYHIPVSRPMTLLYAIGFTIAMVLWILSGFIGAPWRFALWAVAILIEVFTPLLAIIRKATLPLHRSHFEERYGLLTLIVLGESVAGVVQGLAHTPQTPLAFATASLGFCVGFGFWWLYFDRFYGWEMQRWGLTRLSWINTHLPLLIGLGILATGVKLSIAATELPALGLAEHWLMYGGAALCFLMLAALHSMVTPPEGDAPAWAIAAARLVMGALTLAVGWLCQGTGALTATAFLAVLMGVAGLVERFVLPSTELEPAEPPQETAA